MQSLFVAFTTADGQQKNAVEKPQVTVKEYLVPPTTFPTTGPQCDTVKGVTLDWTVPGIQRLWLGASMEDKGRRLKTFLGSMSCDVNGDENLLVNTSYVPQQFVMLCCVLRCVEYIDELCVVWVSLTMCW